MELHATVLSTDAEASARWAGELAAAARGLVDARFTPGQDGQLVFVDASVPDLEAALARIERKGRAVFVLASEGSAASLSALVASGQADDLLLHPFRPLELASRFRQYQQLLMWDEVRSLNASLSELVARVQQDLGLASRLQKSQAPARFPAVKGFRVGHRYLAGMRSGGDHFDLAEATSGNQLSLVLSDSSSYGLSSSVLSVLMRVAMKLSSDEARSCAETVRRIQDELLLTLNEKDSLSLFYGIISRKDYALRYVNLGTTLALYAGPKAPFGVLASQGAPISRASTVSAGPIQSEARLEPGGRLALISDGFAEELGGTAPLVEVLNRLREQDAADSLNEIVFKVKSGFAEPDDLPAQDCTALILDIDEKILRQLG